jgi:hypothetical protein
LPEAPLRRRHQGARENPEQAAYFIPAGLTGRSAFAIRKKSWIGRYGWRGPSHVPRKEASIMIGTNKFLMLDHCPSARCYGTASHRGRSVERLRVLQSTDRRLSAYGVATRNPSDRCFCGDGQM